MLEENIWMRRTTPIAGQYLDHQRSTPLGKILLESAFGGAVHTLQAPTALGERTEDRRGRHPKMRSQTLVELPNGCFLTKIRYS